MFENPVFLTIIAVVAVVFIFNGTMIAIAFLRGRKGNIEDVLNRDKKAMDELRKRVEELEKKE
jgi:hypothetical protein